MLYPPHPLQHLLDKDSRYDASAYDFVLDALEVTRNRLAAQRGGKGKVKHVTARELLDGFRNLALEQFGYMAGVVLRTWGVQSTSDVGELVYNLIENGYLEKSDEDSRTEFDDIFDFEIAFSREFRIKIEPTDL